MTTTLDNIAFKAHLRFKRAPQAQVSEYITASTNDDLEAISEDLVVEYSSMVIHSTLLSSNSLLVVSSIEDYELIKKSNYGVELTEYYAYNETSDFNEIVDWSRFFVSEENASQWKYGIDNLSNLMPNEEVEISLVDMTLAGTIEKNEISDLGNRFVKVNIDSEYNGTYFTVYFGASSTSGKIYTANGESYVFEFEGDFGYVMPKYELNYLKGALGLD